MNCEAGERLWSRPVVAGLLTPVVARLPRLWPVS